MQRNARLSQRIAQEAQLLAEEKWIIETLRKLKQQRNSLQIERLHLENLRATLKNKDLRNLITAEKPAAVVPETSSQAPEQAAPPEEQMITTLSQFDVPMAGIDDEMCNNVKLNLSVTDSVFTNQQFNTLDMEEDEEDLDNGLGDEEDIENTLIDMNMLMQANPR
ncbi:hypothetical protein PYW08_008940 [Mythimna loreyi]|uniref:Uncharacterized protein n=1 Tax=Mythimna loreyi TaxID=667449 RepID=A0ACC2QEU6_9NEOP|nr:hypothetical protein PYW08_008940 [Mythimna loreyi]